ncbi:MAG: TonB-dependent receptor plug domain-containing protein [Spirochaetes bacterium]|nr:TonB-dependent receptor plug domain-containing protein [Spirochaetota bacterium]
MIIILLKKNYHVLSFITITIALVFFPLLSRGIEAQVLGNNNNITGGFGKSSATKKAGDPFQRKKKHSGVFSAGEIIVSGKAIANINAAAITTTINQEDIRDRSEKTLDDSLETVPGVAIERHTKGHVRAKIRGFDQDKIAVLVDGIPVIDIYSTDVDLSDIPVMNVSRIYVNRGVSSALYGTGGAVGSINVVTRKPTRLFAEANGEYGQYKNGSASFAHGAPFGKFYYWITGSFHNSGGYRPSAKLDRAKKISWYTKFIKPYLYNFTYDQVTMPAQYSYLFDDGKWNHNEYRKYNLAAKIGYEFSNHVDVGVAALFRYGSAKTNTYENNCFSDYKLQNLWWKDPLFQVPTQGDVKKAALRNRSFVWPKKYRYTVYPYITIDYDRLLIRANVFVSYDYASQLGYADNWHFYEKDAPAARPNDGRYCPVYDYETYMSYGVNVYPSYRITEWNRLNMAVTWREDRFTSRQKAKSLIESWPVITAGFGLDKYTVSYLKASFLTVAIEDEVNIKDRLRLSAGISYDAQNFTKFKSRNKDYPDFYGPAYIVRDKSTIWGTRDSFNPVAGIVITAVPDLLDIKIAGSMKTRFPTLGEYDKVIASLYDRGLKPERSYNGNAGYQFYFLDRSLSFGADYFISLVRNRIEKIAGSDEPPVNIEKIVSQGAEAYVTFEKKNISIFKKINASFYYTYLNCVNMDDSWNAKVNKGPHLELTPEHQIVADLRLLFKSDTMLALWGNAKFNQIMYAMRVRPAPDVQFAAFSRSFFEPVKLHNPFMLNVKISQKIYKYITVYILCKNILDDYFADPFNPGPGRMFYGGINLKY